MPEIRLLDESTIDKIAAGEVIERPCSVVKELVENAVDAGANTVTVEIKGGGISLIRVTDNGCGIGALQIPTAFLRHSTSKIRTASDLVYVSSLGFRGEALSSIASVSKVELITRETDAFAGSRYVIEGGKEITLEETAAPCGTTFLIRDLFYNTPARRKFLKSEQTEAGYISDVMEHMALSRPDVSFKFINNGQIRLHTSGNGKPKDMIYHIYGRDIATDLIEIKADTGTCLISGFIGKPSVCRGNRNFESYFINGRYIKSKLLAKAIEDAYRGFLMQHKFPFTVLYLTIDPERIDVNVHPNKMQLRISEPEKLYEDLMTLIRLALQQKDLVSRAEPGQRDPAPKKEPVSAGAAAEQFEKKRLQKLRADIAKDSPYEKKYDHEPSAGGALRIAEENSFDTGSKNQAKQKDPSADTAPKETFISEDKKKASHYRAASDIKKNTDEDKPLRAQQKKAADVQAGVVQESFLDKKESRPGLFGDLSSYRIIGQLFDTYFLLEAGDKFYMIDQHAAHEKILYERTMRGLKDKEHTSQLISPPIIITLSLRQEELIKAHLPAFERLGFEISTFGGNEYSISAVPGNLYGLDSKDVFIQIIDGLNDIGRDDDPDIVLEKIASMSCKAAVKGGSSLSAPEAKALIEELLELENPYFCPHGRPVIISMSKYDIEKKFKRIV